MNGLVTQSDWTELIEGFTLVNNKSVLLAIVFELEVVFTCFFFLKLCWKIPQTSYLFNPLWLTFDDFYQFLEVLFSSPRSWKYIRIRLWRLYSRKRPLRLRLTTVLSAIFLNSFPGLSATKDHVLFLHQ